jgi:hypothetical protein
MARRPTGTHPYEWLYEHPEGDRGNSADRKAFRKWCGEERFAAWYERALTVAEQGEGDRDVERLEADFYADGWTDYIIRKGKERLVRSLLENLPDVTDDQRVMLEAVAYQVGPLDELLP